MTEVQLMHLRLLTVGINVGFSDGVTDTPFSGICMRKKTIRLLFIRVLAVKSL